MEDDSDQAIEELRQRIKRGPGVRVSVLLTEDEHAWLVERAVRMRPSKAPKMRAAWAAGDVIREEIARSRGLLVVLRSRLRKRFGLSR